MIRTMKRLLEGILLPLALSTLSSCATAAQLDLTEQENGKDIRVDLGDLIVIHLPANPTTGYDWSYSATGKGMLRQEGEVVREAKGNARGMVGAPITETWKLKALRPGSLSITFSYNRPWEKGVAPAKTVSWPVLIRP